MPLKPTRRDVAIYDCHNARQAGQDKVLRVKRDVVRPPVTRALKSDSKCEVVAFEKRISREFG